MRSLDNKHIWITGASSGIGKSLALEIAAENITLALSGRNEDKLEHIKKACEQKGAKVALFPFDLENIEAITEVVDAIIKELGHIDILINNGGISQRSLVEETPLAIDRKVMNINFFGNIALTKALLPHMINNGGGHIAVTTSIVGRFGFPLRSAYAASKHALYGFYESMMIELAEKNIKVTMICPGRINTPISLNAINKKGEKYNKMDEGQANGMSAEKCAKIIVKGLKKEKRNILVGGKETILVYFKKYFPFLFYNIVKKIKLK